MIERYFVLAHRFNGGLNKNRFFHGTCSVILSFFRNKGTFNCGVYYFILAHR